MVSTVSQLLLWEAQLRFCTIDGNHFVIHANETNEFVISQIPLMSIQKIMAHPEKVGAFTVCHPNGNDTFIAQSEPEMTDWILLIQEHCVQLIVSKAFFCLVAQLSECRSSSGVVAIITELIRTAERHPVTKPERIKITTGLQEHYQLFKHLWNPEVKENCAYLIMMMKKQVNDKNSTSAFLADFELGKVLGTGGFSVVRQALEKSTGEKFAVKIVNRAQLSAKVHTTFSNNPIELLCNVYAHIGG
jgi:hypothetical protein